MNYQRLNSTRLSLPSGRNFATSATKANTTLKNASTKNGLKTSTISQFIGANYTGDRR